MRAYVARRLLFSAMLLSSVTVFGATVFWGLGHGRWRFFDCLYFTVVTLGTIGYGETLPGFEQVPYARPFTLLLIVLGTGIVVYVASNATALVVEGDLSEALRLGRQRRAIAKMTDHVVLCGAGRSGVAALEGLRAAGREVVVVDNDAARVVKVRQQFPGTHVFVGDASEDAVLEDLGARRAWGIAVALGDDRNTLFTVLSARALNASAHIVARAMAGGSVAKLERAGADRVVFETALAGMRIASQIVRPTVVDFIDAVLRDPRHPVQLAEIPVAAGTAVAGHSLGALQLRRHADVIVVALRMPDGKHRFNPTFETTLEVGTVLMALGTETELARARSFVAGKAAPAAATARADDARDL